jgi:hypothetical protein
MQYDINGTFVETVIYRNPTPGVLVIGYGKLDENPQLDTFNRLCQNIRMDLELPDNQTTSQPSFAHRVIGGEPDRPCRFRAFDTSLASEDLDREIGNLVKSMGGHIAKERATPVIAVAQPRTGVENIGLVGSYSDLEKY